MFSSNQVLSVSGDLDFVGDLRDSLEYGLKKSGYLTSFTQTDTRVRCTYQIDKDENFCIGWCSNDEPPTGWNIFQFDFDIDIIAAIIQQKLLQQDLRYIPGDGSVSKGFLMKNLSVDDESVLNPAYGILIFKPYTCFYAK